MDQLLANENLWQVIIQLLIWLLCLLLSLLFRELPRRLISRLRSQVHRAAWTQNLTWMRATLGVADRVVIPFVGWLFGQVGIRLLAWLDMPNKVMHWLLPFLIYWTIYRLLAGVLTARMPASRAHFWRTRLLRPFWILFISLHAFGWLDDVLEWGITIQNSQITLGGILLGVALITILYLLTNTLRQYLGKSFLPKAGVTPALTQAISALVGYGLALAGFFTILGIIGFDLTTLTVIAGGLSVGIGFGLQEIISNFLSGFILLFERSISPGDVIKVNSTVGKVEEIGIRSMRVRTNDNIELIVPNSHYLTEVVTNYTRSDLLVRIQIQIGVGYQSDPRQVVEALLTSVKGSNALTEPAPQVDFTDFGDNALLFELEVWTNDPLHIPRLSSELRFRIWDALKSYQIEVPFPQRDIHIRSVPADYQRVETRQTVTK